MKMTGLVFHAIYLFCLVGAPGEAFAETVSGTVRDAAGHFVAHAYVEAIPVITKQSGGTVGNLPNPWVAADANGKFILNLARGRYRIRAKDEADGYPDPSFWINLDRSAKFPEIMVSDKGITDIKVVLSRQGGMIRGQLRDAETRKPIAGAKIRIQDARNADAYIEIFTDSSGHFQYTVPGNPLLFSAASQGYKATAFENGGAVTLLPGEHREFQIEMEHE
jgi:Carboxypeptidase regulatory-like domain